MSLAFIGAAVLFLPLFVFLPKLLQRAMRADVDAVILVTINAWIITIPFFYRVRYPVVSYHQ